MSGSAYAVLLAMPLRQFDVHVTSLYDRRRTLACAPSQQNPAATPSSIRFVRSVFDYMLDCIRDQARHCQAARCAPSDHSAH